MPQVRRARRMVASHHRDKLGRRGANVRRDGHGLASMRTRAENLSGTVEVNSGSQGTTITLTVPWAH